MCALLITGQIFFYSVSEWSYASIKDFNIDLIATRWHLLVISVLPTIITSFGLVKFLNKKRFRITASFSDIPNIKDGGTINQIDYVVDTLKNNPNSRRILFHGWNVEYLPDEKLSPQENAKNGKMALPPCHLLYQFYVADNKLSLMLTIRSNDLFLGCPFNVAQAAVWVHVLADQCDLDLGELIVSIGDAHIYTNHLEQVELQLTRETKDLPKLLIKRKPNSIYDYKAEDFELVGYDPHPGIKAPVAI